MSWGPQRHGRTLTSQLLGATTAGWGRRAREVCTGLGQWTAHGGCRAQSLPLGPGPLPMVLVTDPITASPVPASSSLSSLGGGKDRGGEWRQEDRGPSGWGWGCSLHPRPSGVGDNAGTSRRLAGSEEGTGCPLTGVPHLTPGFSPPARPPPTLEALRPDMGEVVERPQGSPASAPQVLIFSVPGGLTLLADPHPAHCSQGTQGEVGSQSL